MEKSSTQRDGSGIASRIAATIASGLKRGNSSCLGSTAGASITRDVKGLDGFIIVSFQSAFRGQISVLQRNRSVTYQGGLW